MSSVRPIRMPNNVLSAIKDSPEVESVSKAVCDLMRKCINKEISALKEEKKEIKRTCIYGEQELFEAFDAKAKEEGMSFDKLLINIAEQEYVTRKTGQSLIDAIDGLKQKHRHSNSPRPTEPTKNAPLRPEQPENGLEEAA